MNTERITIDVEKLQRVFETVIEMHYGRYPNSVTVTAFLNAAIREATVRGRDIVGCERDRLLKGLS